MHPLFFTAPATQARENEPGAILKDRTLESGRLLARPSFFLRDSGARETPTYVKVIRREKGFLVLGRIIMPALLPPSNSKAPLEV